MAYCCQNDALYSPEEFEVSSDEYKCQELADTVIGYIVETMKVFEERIREYEIYK
jgi:hypothetical protein